jgi:hypothetical protein
LHSLISQLLHCTTTLLHYNNRNQVIASLGVAQEEGRTMDAYSNFQLPVELFEHVDRPPAAVADPSQQQQPSSSRTATGSNHPDAFLSGTQGACVDALDKVRDQLATLDVSSSS